MVMLRLHSDCCFSVYGAQFADDETFPGICGNKYVDGCFPACFPRIPVYIDRRLMLNLLPVLLG